MEPEISLLHVPDTVTFPYPKPVQSSPRFLIKSKLPLPRSA